MLVKQMVPTDFFTKIIMSGQNAANTVLAKPGQQVGITLFRQEHHIFFRDTRNRMFALTVEGFGDTDNIADFVGGGGLDHAVTVGYQHDGYVVSISAGTAVGF